jgi:hypothetical protein
VFGNKKAAPEGTAIIVRKHADFRKRWLASPTHLWKVGLWKVGLWKVGLWKVGLWKVGLWKVGLWKVGLWKVGLWKVGAARPRIPSTLK